MGEPHPCAFLTMPACGYSLALSRDRMGTSRDLFPPAFFVNCCPSNVLLDIHPLTNVRTPAKASGILRAVGTSE